jgi:D-serine dehydratase
VLGECCGTEGRCLAALACHCLISPRRVAHGREAIALAWAPCFNGSHDPSAAAPLDTLLDGRTKGFPQGHPPLRLGEVGAQRWTLLGGQLDTPVALLKASALDANAAWMADFLRRTGASLCPHGKTSMAPQLFHRQLADGAWGITLATPQQVRVAYDFGVKRVLLANLLLAEGPIAWVQRLLDEDPELDLTCLVDSLEGVRRLESAARGRRPIPVLLELGLPGGRTGARDLQAALAVAREVKTSMRLRLRGVECFEGIVGSPEAAVDRARVEAWLDSLAELGQRCAAEDLFETDEVLLTAGGSAHFDLVVGRLSSVEVGRPRRVLLRSGCYRAAGKRGNSTRRPQRPCTAVVQTPAEGRREGQARCE